ncbi:MAG: iron export ABC transporter permease subunit FetB [Phycisphaeraceae bacterium]|nr:iron export ABC transporter permease subunit FetB [Phycisphaeraceae bacterium]
MGDPLIQLTWMELTLCGAMIAAVVIAGIWLRLGLAGQVLWATVRATVQLLAVGLVIGWVFQQEAWYTVTGLLAIMVVIAGLAGSRRAAVGVRGVSRLLTPVLAIVTGVTLVFLGGPVLNLEGWDGRYLIPLGGMVLGNAMTAGTLSMERFTTGLKNGRARIEAGLSLGLAPTRAARKQRRAAITAALTPTLNTMMVVGVVKLPGMMTGQILGGSDPMQASLYQLLILGAIIFADAMTAIGCVLLLQRRCFNDAWQLVLPADHR